MTESLEYYAQQIKRAEDAVRALIPTAVEFLTAYTKDQGDLPTPGATLTCSVRDRALFVSLSVYGQSCVLAPIVILDDLDAAINGWWACMPYTKIVNVTDLDQWQKAVLFLYGFKDGGKDAAGHKFQKAIADANACALIAHLGQLDPTPQGALRSFMNVHVEALKRDLKTAEAAFKQVPPTQKRRDT